VPEAPDDIATRCCSCKDYCSSRRCLCRRWGGSCKEGCKCQTTGHCCNIFSANTLYFGAQPDDCNTRATYCFIDYLEKAEKIDHRRPFHNSSATSSRKGLEQLLLATDSFFDESAELREWRNTLSTLKEGSGERAAHMQWLFRLGLSLQEGDSRFYSFCNKQWTSQDTHRHCAACKRCCSVDTSWHCGVCRQCRHEGLNRTCYRCGGRSSTEVSRQEEYEIWRNMELNDDSRVASADRESTHGSDHHDFNVIPSIEASRDEVVGTGGNLPSHPGPLTAPRLEPSGS
jgi:hypothetical protein